jgi:hypothetical protein
MGYTARYPTARWILIENDLLWALKFTTCGERAVVGFCYIVDFVIAELKKIELVTS